MDVVVLIGRILFALLFLGSGFGHFAQRKEMTQYAQSKGIPAAGLSVPASGVLLIAGGLSVLLGVWADLGALLLIAFLLPTAFLMHAFWKETDQQTKQAEMIQFNKDVALAGASLMIFGLLARVGGDLGLTLTRPLFTL